MAIPVVSLKREVIEIPLGKREPLLSPKLARMCVDGRPHKSTGPASTPSVVRGGNSLARRQGLLPAIRFHDLKYNLGTTLLPYGVHPMSQLQLMKLTPGYGTMTIGGRTITSGARTTTTGGPTTTSS
jgi:hypothetical protein